MCIQSQGILIVFYVLSGSGSGRPGGTIPSNLVPSAPPPPPHATMFPLSDVKPTILAIHNGYGKWFGMFKHNRMLEAVVRGGVPNVEIRSMYNWCEDKTCPIYTTGGVRLSTTSLRCATTPFHILGICRTTVVRLSYNFCATLLVTWKPSLNQFRLFSNRCTKSKIKFPVFGEPWFFWLVRLPSHTIAFTWEDVELRAWLVKSICSNRTVVILKLAILLKETYGHHWGEVLCPILFGLAKKGCPLIYQIELPHDKASLIILCNYFGEQLFCLVVRMRQNTASESAVLYPPPPPQVSSVTT